MTKELEQLRDELAEKYSLSEKYKDREHDFMSISYKIGWDRLLKHLTEAAGEFDKVACLEASDQTSHWDRECFFQGARWQFEQDRARIGLEKAEIKGLHARIASCNQARKELEARLAESEEFLKSAVLALEKEHDKLTAAKAACDSNAQLALKLRERVRELSEFIKEKGLR